MTEPLPWPTFVCWPCRTDQCLRCDRLRGCEHVLVDVTDDGRLILCPALEVR